MDENDFVDRLNRVADSKRLVFAGFTVVMAVIIVLLTCIGFWNVLQWMLE